MSFFEMITQNIGAITKTVGALVGGVVGLYIIAIFMRIYFYKRLKGIQNDYRKKINNISNKIDKMDAKLDKILRKK